MQEVVGSTLVSKGMSIELDGVESRRVQSGWEETDLLGMAWYSVHTPIHEDQTIAEWQSVMGNNSWTEHRIFANHKFVDFKTESNVYQGAHFVYFPYERAVKVGQKIVNANGLDFTVSAAEDMSDELYDMYNKAFYLSAQDFVSGDDVNDAGELNKQFRLAPMVNVMTVQAKPNFPATATALKNLKITSVNIAAQGQNTFANTLAIRPNLIPAVVRTTEGSIDGTATDAALYAYAKGAEKVYTSSISRNVDSKANYDLSAARNINVFTFPTSTAYTVNEKQPIIYVNVVSPNGLVGSFAAAQYSMHTETNKLTVDKLHKFLGTGAAASLQNILQGANGWTSIGLPIDLVTNNINMVYDINNKAQWDDAVALAKEIGKAATFNLVGDVEFTTDVNLPEAINLTVNGTGKMIINGNIDWPNANGLNVMAANIEVKHGMTLTINGTETDRNQLNANIVNKGTIDLNEYGNIQNVANNGRIVVEYGSYVEAVSGQEGIIAYEYITDTPSYMVKNLINSSTMPLGNVYVNTIIVNAGNELNLNHEDIGSSVYDPYTGTTVVVPAVRMPDLDNVNIEMNGGFIYASRETVKSVGNVTALTSETNKLCDVNVKGNLTVKNGAKLEVNATPNVAGYKVAANVSGDIKNEGKLCAEVSIIATNVNNKTASSELYVNDAEVVWYKNEYFSGTSALAKGSVLKYKSTYSQLNASTTSTQTVENAVFDGLGNTIKLAEEPTADTYGITTHNGVIRNVKIEGAERGIYVLGTVTGDITFDNVTIDNCIYTFNVNSAEKTDYKLNVTNSVLYGWTSFANVFKSVDFVGCTFGKGKSDYNYCRPHGNATFTNCAFEKGYTVDAYRLTGGIIELYPELTFVNCTLDGQPLTAANIAELIDEGDPLNKVTVE